MGFRRLVHPDCCDLMRKTQAILLVISESFYDGDNETVPVWKMAGHCSYDEIGIPISERTIPNIDDELCGIFCEVTFCPFCSVLLPKIVPRFNPPKNICKCCDGGYYCENCDKRLNECQCYPPVWQWMPYRYYDDFGDKKKCKCGYEYHHHFDSCNNMIPIECGECKIFEPEI